MASPASVSPNSAAIQASGTPINGDDLSIPARDGFLLAATVYRPAGQPKDNVVVVNSATAVPRRFYGTFAAFLAETGFTAVTYDYRGVGGSRPASLRGFRASAGDWVLQDMAGVVDWVETTLRPRRQFHVGHSFGGQTPGLLPNGDRIAALVTLSAQSGYWRLQGGSQKLVVGFHVHLTLPLLALLVGYVPWSWLGPAEDLPQGVGLQWSRWCRRPGYLLDDDNLPLERYRRFRAPVLAYSFADDDWGTPRAVDAMMTAYPNLTRRHVRPVDVGVPSIGHFGFFRSSALRLWREVVDWMARAAPGDEK